MSSIAPRGTSILELYRWYRTGKLMVNRQYQRKLVWSRQEKADLIDSILSAFPVPLILLAELSHDGDGVIYEIIDGMQRLNAIFSFIENHFAVTGKYFDVSILPLAQNMVNDGVFKPVERVGTVFLSSDQGAAFLEYQLPVTTYKASSTAQVQDIFGRINSNGKHLSSQEVRQAGVTSAFASLVRELAAELRGDATKNVLPLTDMPQISIDSKLSNLGYGIAAEDTFWCHQGILKVSQLRDSDDEQFIADIVLSIIFEQPLPASKEEFDACYGKADGDDRSEKVHLALSKYGVPALRSDIKAVFGELRRSVDAVEGGALYLKKILNPKAGSNPVKEPFYSLFMACFELMIQDNKMPFDYGEMFKALIGLANHIKSPTKYVTTAQRVKHIGITKGLIQKHFKAADAATRSAGSLAIDFENYLRRSRIEAPFYDFKQGLYTLDSKGRKFDDHSWEKIVQNIAALANLGKGKKGYLFIGVTDKEADTKRVEELDGITAPRVEQFGVVGLEREAKAAAQTLDEYVMSIVSRIRASELPDWVKTSLNTGVMPITYKNQTVLMIEVKAGTGPVFFKEKLYIRDGSSRKEVSGSDVAAVFALFR